MRGLLFTAKILQEAVHLTSSYLGQITRTATFSRIRIDMRRLCAADFSPELLSARGEKKFLIFFSNFFQNNFFQMHFLLKKVLFPKNKKQLTDFFQNKKNSLIDFFQKHFYSQKLFFFKKLFPKQGFSNKKCDFD